jgi:low temperature requirement protein LtrA
MHGIERQEYWSVPAASAAFAGMGTAFFIWWWYFIAARATSAQPIATHRDAVRLHAWSYAHLPLYLGLVVAFVGIQQVVSTAPAPALNAPQVAWLVAALGLAAASIATISRASGRPC